MQHTELGRRGIELVEGLGFEEVKARLLRIGAVDEETNRALAFYLADVCARRLYEDGGHSCAVHFAEAQLEMKPRRARELIQVGRELRSLELVDDAFFAGDIGWTKVLLLLRVVQIPTQTDWIEYAKTVSCRELDEEISRCRPGELPGAGTRIGLDANHRAIHAKLDDRTFAMFERVRAFYLARSEREDMTDSEVLTAMTKDFGTLHPDLAGDIDAETPGTDSDATTDSDEFDALPYDHRNHDPVPQDTRDRVLARDRHRCRNCHSYRNPHVHHIDPRASGGSNDPSNLVVLCSPCHSLVHRQKLRISRTAFKTGAAGATATSSASSTPSAAVLSNLATLAFLNPSTGEPVTRRGGGSRCASATCTAQLCPPSS